MAIVTPARAAALLVALVLLWRVIQVNAVLYDDSGRPVLPSIPGEALAVQPGADRDAIVAALRDNPSQVAALLVAARRLEKESPREAAQAYAVAYELAPLDREVLHAASVFFLRQGRFPEAFALLDRLVEHYPDTRERAFPVFADLLASKDAEAAWSRIIARDAAWIGAFVTASCARGVDPALLVPLFMSRVAAGRATPTESACVIDRLRGAGRWDEAYQVWLNTLPRDRLSDVGFVFNGGFENAASGLGFDWMPTRLAERDAGHSVEMARNAGGAAGKRALRVSYNGKRQATHPIAQYLVLPAGRYEFGGLARLEGMRVGRGVQWTVRCVDRGKPGPIVARSERFTGSSDWRPFAFGADIAPACAGQILQLEPVGIEEGAVYLTGTAWFDELAATHAR
jgi:hypothetical protein